VYWIQLADTAQDDPRYGLLNWHFHPSAGRTEPHVHVGVDVPGVGALRKVHLPTAIVPFEAVIRLLIDMGVVPRFADWQAKLDASLELFEPSFRY